MKLASIYLYYDVPRRERAIDFEKGRKAIVAAFSSPPPHYVYNIRETCVARRATTRCPNSCASYSRQAAAKAERRQQQQHCPLRRRCNTRQCTLVRATWAADCIVGLDVHYGNCSSTHVSNFPALPPLSLETGIDTGLTFRCPIIYSVRQEQPRVSWAINYTMRWIPPCCRKY